MLSNEELLNWYSQGWFDECEGKEGENIPPRYKIAYETGRKYYILGDEDPFLDLMLKEEIIEIIKSQY